jgi:serine/threonine-protein kinase
MEKNEKYEKYEKIVGSVLDDRYRLEKLIGVGGMAVVYKATDMRVNNNTVAIKLLKDEAACDEIIVKRFKNECRAESMLNHKNIVAVYDVSTRGDLKYMVMEYVYGITLKNYLIGKKGPLDLDEILSYSVQVLRALKVAHDAGIIHRDIKPQNIMVLESGKIKVMDFGIAKLPNAETVTVTDKAVGTVYYMSPEQASGKTIDKRSDIYSMGAMMYELATGQMPFKGDTPVAILMKHVNEKPVAPRVLNSSIPVGLEQIILCAMSKKPSDRFDTAEEMLSYVKQLHANRKIKFDSLPCNSAWENLKGKFKRMFSKG